MLSDKYNKPLKFDLKPSKYLFIFISIIHLLAISVLFLNLDIPNTVLLMLGLAIVLNYYFSLTGNSSVIFKTYISELHCVADMQWKISSSDQLSNLAELQDKWFSLPWLVILYFKLDNNKRKAIIILPDMITKKNLRQLKLHLTVLKS